MNITWGELEGYLFGELDLDKSQKDNYKSRYNKIRNYFVNTPFKRETIIGYIIELKQQYAPSTVGLFIILLNHICNKLKLPYMEGITLPKRGRVFKHILTKQEQKRVLELAYSLNFRPAVAIELALRYGYRIGTITGLKWADLHGNFIVLRNQKDNNEKQKPLDEIMLTKINQLRKWKNGYVFGNHNGKMSGKFLNSFLRDILSRLNIQKQMTFHDLRHTFASIMHDEGVDIRFLQELLDHKHITTTELYTHVSIESQRKVLKKHPLAIETMTDEDIRQELRDINDRFQQAKYTPIFFEAGSEFILKVPKKNINNVTLTH